MKLGGEIRLEHYFILLLYDLCPSFPKRGVSLYRTNTLKYAVTTSFADFQVANIDNLK